MQHTILNRCRSAGNSTPVFRWPVHRRQRRKVSRALTFFSTYRNIRTHTHTHTYVHIILYTRSIIISLTDIKFNAKTYTRRVLIRGGFLEQFNGPVLERYAGGATTIPPLAVYYV